MNDVCNHVKVSCSCVEFVSSLRQETHTHITEYNTGSGEGNLEVCEHMIDEDLVHH